MEVVVLSAAPAARKFSRSRTFWAIFLIGVGFASLAWTRIDIDIILKEVMSGIGVTSLAAGGLISTLTVLGDGLAEPFMGKLSDRMGRQFSLALGIAIFSLFTLLTAASHSLASMIPIRILLGVGQAMFIPAYFAFLGGAFAQRRGFVLGSLGGLFTVGATINPLATRGVFLSFGAWQAPFVVYGIFGLLLAGGVALIGRTGFYERGRTRESDVTAASTAADEAAGKAGVLSRDMILLLVTMMFWGLTQYGFIGLFVHFLRTHQHFSLGEAAGVATIGSWISFCFSFFGGWMSDHIGRRNALLIFGVVGVLVSYPIFTVTHSFATAAVLAAIFQAANGMFYPLGVSYAQDLARAHNLGMHSGAVSGIGHLVAGFSGVIAGGIASSFGWPMLGVAFVIASVVMVVCIFLTKDPVHLAHLRARGAAAGGGR